MKSDITGQPIDAPSGAVWVCAACGKKSKNNYGFTKDKDRGWDESCMMHSVLCHEGPEWGEDGRPIYRAWEEDSDND